MNKENQIPWMQYTRGQKKTVAIFYAVLVLFMHIQLFLLPWWLFIPLCVALDGFLIWLFVGIKARVESLGGTML